MRVGHLQPTRPEWYDRNPTVIGRTTLTVGPVVLTQAWIYTVPTGKKAYCDHVSGSVLRRSEATATGDVNSYAELRDPGPVTITRFVDLLMLDNVRGATMGTAVPAFGIITAGQILRGIIGDASTGGSTDLRVAAKLTEYDD